MFLFFVLALVAILATFCNILSHFTYPKKKGRKKKRKDSLSGFHLCIIFFDGER